jgi:hypothetical protein
MTDEMDLVGRLKDAEPLRPEAYEKARNVLRAAMADPGTVRVLRETPVHNNGLSGRRNGRRRVGTAGKVGIGAGIGVAAAAAAIALVATSGSAGTAPSAAAGTKSQSPAAASAAQSPLVTLAAYITSNAPSGVASLVVSDQKNSTGSHLQYELTLDSGAIYFGDSLAELRSQYATHRAYSFDAGTSADVKDAAAAATGNLASLRIAMIDNTQNYLGLGLSPTAQKAVWAKGYAAEKASIAQLAKEKDAKLTATPLNAATVKEQADNILWTNVNVALGFDGGNTAVRAGALRLLSTISGVSVAHTTTSGKATLTITAGPSVFGGSGSEVLVVDAKTGALVSQSDNAGNGLKSTTTYTDTRVSAAALKTGNL